MSDVTAQVLTARKYTDISLSFAINPFTRDIVKKTDDEAVKAAVHNLIRTKKYERPFHPEICSDVESLLFENFTPITQTVLKRSIEDVLRLFEPRISILDVIVDGSNMDSNEVRLTIKYQIRSSSLPSKVTVILTRVR